MLTSNYYLASDGTKTGIPCVKDADYASLILEHFSHYIIEAYEPAGEETVTDGSAVTYKGGKYVILSAGKKTAAFVKAKNTKNFAVPAAIKLNGKSYKVTQINAGAFKGKKISKVTAGKNVRIIAANTFKGSGANTLVLKTKLLLYLIQLRNASAC